MARERPDAMLAFPDGFIMRHAAVIADFATKDRVPAVSGWAEFARAGNVMTYGPKFVDSWRHLASYVDRILKGAKPADLPVEQPATFELVIKLRAAKLINLTIPQLLLLRADHVVE